MRIFSGNIASLGLPDPTKWQYTLMKLKKCSVDISCVQETCVNSQNWEAQRMVRESTREVWPFGGTPLGRSNSNSASMYNPGGHLIATRGRVKARVAIITTDPLGRWRTVEISTTGKSIKVICAYIPVQRSLQGSGEHTYIHQIHLLPGKGKRHENP